MPNRTSFNAFNRIAKFGESLNFAFRTEDGKWYYPEISLDGPQGTSASLHGQHMTPDEVEQLGLSLVRFAEKLRSANFV